ncbi:hypothetical protein DFJ77DRAFT_241946 [Powellomyces hirtus]|nr:hypothetical protein DFJ77DRAFT_241946 [Powellomyces hirtus]
MKACRKRGRRSPLTSHHVGQRFFYNVCISQSANEVSQLKKQFESTERRREAEKSNLVAKIATLRNEKESSSSVTKMLQDERNALQSQVISKIEQNEALLHEVATLRSAVSDMEKKLMLKPPTLEANAERQSVQTSQRFEDSVSHIFSQIETMAEPSEGEYGDATDMLQELLMDAGKADDNTAAIGISDVNPVPTKKSIATKRKVLTIEDTDDDDNEEAPDSDKRRKKEVSWITLGSPPTPEFFICGNPMS